MEPEQIEEMLSLADSLVFERLNQHLSDLERQVLEGSLNGQKLKVIASSVDFSDSHIRRIAACLWKKLSECTSERVTQKNVGQVLERCAHPQVRTTAPVVDLLNAPDVEYLLGRENELDKLTRWIFNEKCRLIGLLGMGGIGKSALAAKFARDNQENFDYCIWYSLREDPPIEKTLSDLIQFVSNQQANDIPDTLGGMVTQLISYLDSYCCLLVLDNAESILAGDTQIGQYREGYEGYGILFQRIGESKHKSCLIITSREKPNEVARLEGLKQFVRSHLLLGLEAQVGQDFLKAEGLEGSDEQRQQILTLYSGNPLALRIIANTIRDSFGGNISAFLQQGARVFGDISSLLEEQFKQLSDLGQLMMYWLAVNREVTSVGELKDDILEFISDQRLIETLNSLKRRSLVEGSRKGFTLQNVVMEYLTTRLVECVSAEIRTSEISLLNSVALVKATTKEYVKEVQLRLILRPIARILNLEQSLEKILDMARENQEFLRGYMAGNILNLLCHTEAKVSRFNFSDLTIRYGDLESAVLRDTNFRSCTFVKPKIKQAFGVITSVVFSFDQELLAIGNSNGEILLWNNQTKQLLDTLRVSSSVIRSVAFSPTEKTIAVGGDDMLVHVWNIDTFQYLCSFRGHTSSVSSVVFSPDGKMLASGGIDTTVRLWEIKTHQCIYSFQGHSGSVNSVAFHPDSEIVASGGSDATIRLWDITSQQVVYVIQEEDIGSILSINFSPDGKLIASGSNDATVRLWSLSTFKCTHTFRKHTAPVRSVAFSPRDKVLASGGVDSKLYIWDLDTYRPLKTLPHNSSVRSIAFSPDGKVLASGSVNATIRLWDMRNHQCIHSLKGYNSSIRSLTFSPDGKTLASTSDDVTRSICLWDMNSNLCFHTFQKHTDWGRAIAFSSDGKKIASGSYDTTVHLIDAENRQYTHIFRGHNHWVLSVAFSPDGKRLASGSFDKSIRVWDIRNRQCEYILHGHDAVVGAVAFSTDGRILASGSGDTKIYLWDTTSRQRLNVLHGHIGSVRSVAFSPDGKTLASGGSDATVRLWDMNTHQCVGVLHEHTAVIRTLAFGPNGTKLISGGDDNLVRLWDLTTGKCVRVYEGHNSLVLSVAFHPDGKFFVSGSRDGIIRLWDVNKKDCVHILRSPKPYEDMNITGVKGLTEAQRASLLALGAIDQSDW